MEKEDEQQLNVQGTEPDVEAEAEQKRSIEGVVEAAVQDYDYFQLVLTFLFYLQTLGTLFFPDVELGLWEDAFGWIGSLSLNLDINFDNDITAIAVIEMAFLYPMWLCFELRELIYYCALPRKDMKTFRRILLFLICFGLIALVFVGVKWNANVVLLILIPYLMILATALLRFHEQVYIRTNEFSSERKKRNHLKREQYYGGFLYRFLLMVFKLSLVPLCISCGQIFLQSSDLAQQITALISAIFLSVTVFLMVGVFSYYLKLFKARKEESSPGALRFFFKTYFRGTPVIVSEVWFYPLLELLEKLLLAVNSLTFEDIRGVYVATCIICVTGVLSMFFQPYDSKSLEADILSRFSNLIVLALIITNEISKQDVTVFMVIITAATLVYWGFRINLKRLLQRLFSYATLAEQYCANCVFQVEVWHSRGMKSFSKVMKRYTHMDRTRWEMLSTSQQMFFCSLKTPKDPPKNVSFPNAAKFYDVEYKEGYAHYGFYSLQAAEVFRLIGKIKKKEDFCAFIESSKMLSYTPKLGEVLVRTVKFHDDAKFLFKSIAEHCTVLWRIELKLCDLRKVDGMLFMDLFHDCTSIRDFRLIKCKISKGTMSDVFRSVAASKHLRYFSTEETDLPCESVLEAFADFEQNTSLRTMNLSGNSFNVVGNREMTEEVRQVLLNTVSKMSGLKKVYFSGWETTNPLPPNVTFKTLKSGKK